MKKRIKLIIIGILVVGMVVFISVCALSYKAQETNDSRVTYKGKILTVVLKENPTTPYVWEFTIEGNSLKALDDNYVQDLGGQMRDGVGGTHTFRFEGVSEGTVVLNMNHLSRNPEEINPLETIVIEVQVSSDGTIKDVKVVN